MFAKERDQLKSHVARLEVELGHLWEEVIPGVSEERDQLKSHVERLAVLETSVGQVPPGHFYSPVPDFDGVLEDSARIWPDPRPGLLVGIDLNDDGQVALLGRLNLEPVRHRRFSEANPAFGVLDTRLYTGMLRDIRPRRVIEVGSGHSTALLLDMVDETEGFSPAITCIDPDPTVLQELLDGTDFDRITLLEQRVQDVDPVLFASLERGDVLFIDSTHVAKIGSDVNHLILEIVPGLADGVVIHIHDIGYPFEYPRKWIEQGRAWNEAYLVRALLVDNSALRVLLFASYLQEFHSELLGRRVFGHRSTSGGSLWLQCHRSGRVGKEGT